MFAPIFFLLLIFPGIDSLNIFNTLDLNGIWDALNSKGGYRLNASVPGSIYLPLVAAASIGDPYYRDNDVKYRWVARENWIYTRLFYVSPDVLSKSSVVLVTEGLDTFATVKINDKVIGTSENMFVRHVNDIKHALKVDLNNITIEFKSAVIVAEELNNKSAYPIPPGCPNPAQHGECYRNFIRKEQCSFSWDWGPSFPGQGIWKDIYIQFFDEAVIRQLTAVATLESDNKWFMTIELDLDVYGSIVGQVETYLDSIRIESKLVTFSTVRNVWNHTLQIPEKYPISLWWPNGYGEQRLYNLTVKFTTLDKNETMMKSIKIGFRTVQVIQEPVSNNASQGLTFYFLVNKIPIFFKGTNWIPSDSFLERVSRTRLQQHLISAAEVHINSMRVWGGGVYESDEFYELCDELGIMIWHDMMFSDALYPTTDDFLATVIQEIRQQIQRLKYHPSIVLWAANNENEGIVSNKKEVPYKKDYVKLYIDTIMPTILMYDKTRAFLPSSPTNGPDSQKQGWIANNSRSEYFGDDHYYNYNADLWSWMTFPTPRFASEFGSEAWCNFETIEKVFDEADLDYYSAMADHRQHHQDGNKEMLNQTAMHITLPTSGSPKQIFKNLIYVIQINQAMSIRTEAETYRRWTNQLNTDGRGLTMGALYWQLNDIWQAPTWSSIDYDVKWKMLHYYVKKFFNPNLISPYVDGDDLKIYMVIDEIPVYRRLSAGTDQVSFRPKKSFKDMNDSLYNDNQAMNQLKKSILASEGTVILEVYTWTSMQPLKSWNIPFNLNQTSGLIYQKNLDYILNDANCPDKTKCFLYLYLNSKTSPTSTSWLPLTYFTNIQGVIPRATIKVLEVLLSSHLELTITLSTNTIAPFVWIDCHGISGRFSDNGFLMKDPLIQLTFTSWQPVDLQTFKNCLSVQSLMDIYQ